MKYICFDLSTSESGWALFDKKKVIQTGTIKASSVLDRGERVVYMAHEMMRLVMRFKCDEMITEDIYMNPGMFTAFAALSELKGAVLYAYHQIRLRPPITFMASHARSRVGLPARGKKSEIIKGLWEEYQIKVPNDHIADAVVLGLAYQKDLDENPEA